MGGSASFPMVQLNRDRIVIVTGGNTGIGYEMAKWIAIMGATVIIGCRSEQRAMDAIKRMQDEYREMKDRKQVNGVAELDSLALEYMNLDLGTFASTKKFAEDFKKSGRPLHVLICNAGIAITPFRKTDDGFESMLQVNYLSHFLLTAKLLPIMLKSGDDCRIFSTSSSAHSSASFDLDTINYSGQPDKFGRMDYYGRSKLYQIMQTHCMVRRLQNTNISVNTSHPGVVDTEADRNIKDLCCLSCMIGLGRTCGALKSPKEGATSVINGSVNPALKGVNGCYFVNCRDASVTSTARDENKQEAVWKKTLEYLKDHITEEELKSLEGGQSSHK